MNKCVARGVSSAGGAIATIGKHVIAQCTLAGRCECVGVEESTDCGVVITRLQVIESSISDGILAKTPFLPPHGDSKIAISAVGLCFECHVAILCLVQKLVSSLYCLK